MYHYNGFGLNISTDIAFPELAAAQFAGPDVTIKLGEVPYNSVANVNNYSISNQNFFWDLAGVGKYHAFTGNHIVIEPVEGANQREVRSHLLGTVMAVLLHQRGCLPLHASAIKIKDKLTLLTGDSGAGKSTTVSGLLKKDYQIFADDIVVAREVEGNNIIASSSYPMIKLWDDTIGKLNDNRFNDRTFAITQGLDKYGIFFHDDFDTSSYGIERVFVLVLKDDGAIETEYLTDGKAFNALNNQCYRADLIKSRFVKELNFKMLTNLVCQVEVIQVRRPRNCDPAELVRVVESFF